MINKKAHLNKDLWETEKLEKEPTRNGFGRGLLQAGKNDDQVVALCADLAESTRSHWFREEFPDRYIEMGVAEQNLAATAAGFAAMDKIPFIMSYAAFSPGRNNEQIRTTISLNDVPVKVVGCHAGLSVGPDGATHQALEDIALMRVQPNMSVIVPCDAEEAYKATLAIAQSAKPAYLRLARAKAPVFTTKQTPFEIGKGIILEEHEDPDVLIIATGDMVYQALLASQKLNNEHGIASEVMNIHTIKPLDTKLILEHAKKAGHVVTIEEHQRAGGMGSAVAEYLAENHPVPMRIIGVDDRFGQSGTKEELYKEYGLDVASVVSEINMFLKNK